MGCVCANLKFWPVSAEAACRSFSASTNCCDSISESDIEAMKKKCLEEVREHQAMGLKTQKIARNQDINVTSHTIQEQVRFTSCFNTINVHLVFSLRILIIDVKCRLFS